MEFFRLLPPSEAIDLYLDEWGAWSPSTERIATDEAGGRVLAEDICAAEDFPGFARSTMDGYAVRAKDTFGASESAQALFSVAGEILIGAETAAEVRMGEAYRIATGAMMPKAADAVVMVEYVDELTSDMIAVGSDVAPGENVIAPDEDLKAGEVVIARGKRLRAQDIGTIAALGITQINVFHKPKVSVLSTGNEIVLPMQRPNPGQVRDTNGPALMAALKTMGCEPSYAGIVPDEPITLTEALKAALDTADAVILSGGSSVGPYDLAPKIIDSMGEPGVVVHGLAIKPGKPTILALAKNKPIIGLPGHPASSLVVFQIVIAPLIRALCGEDPKTAHTPEVRAVLDRNLASSSGREDYIRVSLERREGVLYAVPVLGKSGLVSTLVRSDGIIRIPLESGGYEAGEEVGVVLWTV